MTIRLSLLLLFCNLVLQNLFAQDSTRKFYPEANGTIGNRKKINALSFTTQNTTTPFFEAVEKEFRTPIKEGEFFRYDSRNKNWSREKIIIRISRFNQIDLNKTKSLVVFIFVETRYKHDLLKPDTKSYKKIKQYFFNLFNQTIQINGIDTSTVNDIQQPKKNYCNLGWIM